MNEIKINKQAKSITIINNGIAFSQFGIAKEILDLVDNQQQEIERLNNIINELEKELREGSFDVYFCSTNTQKTFKSNEIIIKSLILDKLKELKNGDNNE